MLAFGLSIALFVFWGIVGYAFLAVLNIRRSSVQNMLLAPVVGMSVTLLPVFWLNRAGGLPIAHFGLALAVGLLLISIGSLWYLRPVFPLKQYWPFATALLLALFLTGRPMLEFGFNWLSYSNDDMANYVLGADRMVDYGFFDIPNATQFVNGSEYRLAYWFFNLSARTGSETLIAWTSSLTGLLTIKNFMPLILALHLVLISSAGALAHQSRRLRPVALMTCILLSFSALTSLSTLYQLIAQVSGVGLLMGCMVLLLHPFVDAPLRLYLRYGVLTALLVSALLITYPEVTPFLFLAFILYCTLGLIRRRLALRPFLVIFAVSVPLTLAALGEYMLSFVTFLRHQVNGAFNMSSSLSSLFPFYVIPSGLANLWGFQSVMGLSPEPLLSITIFLGGVILFLAIAAASWQSWHLNPPAIMTVVMFIFASILLVQHSNFGLFKLASFAQPFLLATLALACFQLAKRRVWQVTPLLLLALFGLFVQTRYVEISRAVSLPGASLTDIPGSSRSGINDEFNALVTRVNPSVVVLDTTTIQTAKFQSLYLRGRASIFPSRQFFFNIVTYPEYQQFKPNILSAIRALIDSWNQRYVNAAFKLQNNSSPVPINKFIIDDIQPLPNNADGVFLITTTPRLSLFNRSQFDLSDQRNFVAFPWAQAENHLIFISSQLGENLFVPNDSHFISFYQLEHDLYYPGKTMAGIGQFFLFQVVNPTRGARFVLDFTTTLKSDGKNELPPAVAIGANRQFFPLVGHGSARVFSPPVTPQTIRGRPYLGIDMGVDGTLFQNNRTGLMALYGTNIPLDTRYLTAFARNISLVSEEAYASMIPPIQIGNFPADLANPNLEYSGLYEDGWIAETAYLNLTQPLAISALVVRGSVPLIDDPSFSTEISVLVDGQEVARKALQVGEFELKLQFPYLPGKQRIDLNFSKTQVLPAPDNRLAAALLSFVGFETK